MQFATFTGLELLISLAIDTNCSWCEIYFVLPIFLVARLDVLEFSLRHSPSKDALNYRCNICTICRLYVTPIELAWGKVVELIAKRWCPVGPADIQLWPIQTNVCQAGGWRRKKPINPFFFKIFYYNIECNSFSWHANVSNAVWHVDSSFLKSMECVKVADFSP